MKQNSTENTARFRKLIEHSYSGVTLLDAAFRIIYRSPSAERISGWTMADRAQKTFENLVHPDDQPALGQTLKMLLQTPGLSLTCTYRSRHHDGHYSWLEAIYSNMLDDPDVMAIVCNFRDITAQKNQELQNTLLTAVSGIFNEPLRLSLLLDKLLERLVAYGHFMLAEVWLIGSDRNRISLVAHHEATAEMSRFYREAGHLKSFVKGEGLPGSAWSAGAIQFWDQLGERPDFLRREAAGHAGLYMAYSIPLLSENTVIGALLLGMGKAERPDANLISLFDVFSTRFGAEIKRKQQEEELNLLFNSAPDIICIAGLDRYFKKINPAMCAMLGYSEEELLANPLTSFIHPDDREKNALLFEQQGTAPTFYFENRFLTKSGKIKWIAWTTTRGLEEGLFFSIGKDITEKKELAGLLDKVTDLAQIGGWEIDLVNQSLYWSKMTQVIHEVEPDFAPDLETALRFYKEEIDRALIRQKISLAIEKGEPFDFELQIMTAKDNLKWVRVLGEPEFVSGKCVRIYGSFQDVDARVKAELKARDALKERNVILESIGDAFFAVDKKWVVTYWNKTAEKVLGKSKKEMLDHNLWEEFAAGIGSESYKRYHRALRTNKAVHFEDYYPPLLRWYEISAYPSSGGLSVYFKDVTERKKTEGLLKDSERRYSDLFQLSPLPKWVFDLETRRFLDVNEAALTLYGYTREEFLSMNITEIRPPEELARMEAAFREDQKAKSNIYKGVFTHKKKNGELIRVDVQSNNIRYNGRNAKIVVANDITERLNYIRAIEEQNEKLREISWMQSHVIRAPLARIMGLIQLIESENGNPAQIKKMLKYLKISSDELDKVIGDITKKTEIVGVK